MSTTSEIKLKLKQLRKLDGAGFFRRGRYQVFGSDHHCYRMNRKLSYEKLKDFETKLNVELPHDYSQYLLEIGNGGAGPYYGMLQLSQWNTELYEFRDELLSVDFPHSEKWNVRYAGDAMHESSEGENDYCVYFDNQHVSGSIRICHYGCAIYAILVVTGKEKGNIWIDDRANDQGIYPVIAEGKDRLDFSAWYNSWLDESLNKSK